MNICVFGDSTAWGAWDAEKGGWVNRLWLYYGERDLRDGEYVEVYNMSISGGTSETILNRLDAEAKAREPKVIIIQTGGNDSAYLDGQPDNYWVKPEKFEENLKNIFAVAGKYADKVIFLGFKKIDDNKTQPVPWDKKVSYSNKNIKLYNEIAAKACVSAGVSFIDIYDLLDPLKDLQDGIHPNSIGHRKIFEKVRDFLVGQGIGA